MYTLQVLDRGQTFFYSLPDRVAVIGSDPAVDLRLEEDDVAAVHARLELRGEALHLAAEAPVRVNGVAVAAADLQLGDRVEIGRAVLMVGKAVARAASPEDVLDAPAVTRRERRDPRAAPKRSKLPMVFAAAVIVGLIALAVLTNSDTNVVRGEIDTIARLRDKGDIDGARARIAACRQRWVGAEDDRLQWLERAETAVDGVAAAIVQLEARILDPDSGNKAEWYKELQYVEAYGAEFERVAAHIVHARLTETWQRRESTVTPAPGPVEAAPPVEVAAQVPAPDTGGDTGGDAVAAAIADAERLAEQGLFAQALSVLQGELGQVSAAADVTRLEARSAQLRAAALEAARALVQQATGLADEGGPREAVTLLTLAQHRFPGAGEFAILADARRGFEAALAAAEQVARPAASAPPADPKAGPPTPGEGARPPVAAEGTDEGTRLASFAMLRVKLDAIRDAEAVGDFARATALLGEAAAAAGARDPEFAARLTARAERAGLRQALHVRVVAALQEGRQLRTVLRAGGEVQLAAADGPRFRTADDRGPFGWPDFTATGIAALAEQVGVAGPAALGAATMIYETGDTKLAEGLLARALRADPGMQQDVDRVIALGRGEPTDGPGYVLEKDRFVSVRTIELRKEADRVHKRIASVARNRDPEVRQEFVAGLLAGGPDNIEVLRIAFERELGDLVGKLDAGPLRKQVDRMVEHRTLLDAARKHAKDLIYDEEKYFYPFKPPAVSGERFAEYNRVQAEVFRRTDAVSALWGDTRTKIKVPSSLSTNLDRIGWCVDVLRRVGSFEPGLVADIEWVRALPLGETITIREFCLTVAEREEWEEWQRIEAYNRVVGRGLSSSARELLRITNDYRALFRHRPLAVSDKICAAAQGHAEEMSRLGYFAHHSPTPGRRTPFDRMRLAGYPYGVSENIATNGSALGAHNAWLRSSGHHRNLLLPTHKEMGIGADGRNWVENFGGGSTYLESEAYAKAGK